MSEWNELVGGVRERERMDGLFFLFWKVGRYGRVISTRY